MAKCPNCGGKVRRSDEMFCSRSCYVIWWKWSEFISDEYKARIRQVHEESEGRDMVEEIDRSL